jgi:AcrR family transcriptional regulator
LTFQRLALRIGPTGRFSEEEPVGKGAQTRQRIVEAAAPVFNRRGYVGASLRELIDATGLEKGGIYNHFGSKEELALAAYDHALAQVADALVRSQEGTRDALEKLEAMIRVFARTARRPVVEGGCPIMNTAIEADDTHPELRARARDSMDRWHRMIGRIVTDGVAAGTLDPGTDPYRLASVLTSALEGGVMLARLFGDPAHMDRVVEHLVAHVRTFRTPQETP